MTDLHLIFLGAAYLNNLVLVKFFDAALGASEHSPRGLFPVAGFLLVLAAVLHGFPQASWRLPPQATAYLRVLAFFATVLTIRPGRAGAAPPTTQPRLLRLRRHLPLLVANMAVLLFALLDGRRAHGWLETAGFCLGASLAFQATLVLLAALRERVEVADVPRIWRGAPIAVLTAGLVALASMGYAGALPW